MKPATARVLVLASVIIWGWTFVASKELLNYLSPVDIIGYRFAIGLPILFGIVIWKRISMALTVAERWSAIWGALVIAAHFLMQVWALQFTSATNTGWIIAVTPLAMAVLSWLFLKEELGRWQVTGILIATTGIVLLISRGELTSFAWLTSTGDWLILASAHTWAIYSVLTRNLSRTRHPMAVTLHVFSPLAVGCIIWILVTGGQEKLVSLPWSGWLALAFLGILGTLAQWFWQEAIAILGASRAGIYLYLEPLATMGLAVTALGEPLLASTVVGGLIVLAGVWVAQQKWFTS